jgi:ABC-type phosphate transport system substrate-binding protein
LLIPASAKNPKNGQIIADFLTWMVNDGQKMAPALSYAPLPDSVAEKVKGTIKQVH